MKETTPSQLCMKKPWITLVLFLFTGILHGQDTLRPEPAIFYSSKTEPVRGKEFASRVKYSREDIVFSDTKRIIEYCYYYDSERNCFGNSYEILDGSAIKINDELWNYTKQGDKYILYRYFRGTYESGLAKTLIPLETIGSFITTTADKTDTLWETDYSIDNPANPYDHPGYTFHKTQITGKIYDETGVDEIPSFLNGDPFLKIGGKREDEQVCYGEPLVTVSSMSFIITANGRIVNIEQKRGNIDFRYCPYYAMDLVRRIYQLGPVKPAKKKGKNVNVRWTINVE